MEHHILQPEGGGGGMDDQSGVNYEQSYDDNDIANWWTNGEAKAHSCEYETL